MLFTHVGPDSLFLKLAVDRFESALPGENQVIAVLDGRHSRQTYEYLEGRTHLVHGDLRGALTTAHKGWRSQAVVAHSMTTPGAAALMLSRPSAARVWSGWGFDYYTERHGTVNAELLGEVTRVEVANYGGKSQSDVKTSTKWRVADLVHRRVAARTTIFSAPIPDDESVFRARFAAFHGDYHQLSCYGSVDFGAAWPPFTQGRTDILVGNSASPYNNHLEVFEMLRSFDLSNRRVVVPLNYGDGDYREMLLRKGRQCLGAAFSPIVEYLPLRDYTQIVESCPVVIMNHVRQQALGNILIALYRGARLYLNPASPVYTFLRRAGAMVFPVSPGFVSDTQFAPLGDDERSQNQRVVSDLWGESVVSQNIVALAEKTKGRRQALRSRSSGRPPTWAHNA